MNWANVLTSLGAGALGSGVIVALVNGLFDRDGKRAEAALNMAEVAKSKHETAIRDHELWRAEAKDSYAQVKQECADCKTELKEAKQDHDKEMIKLHRELAEIRDALIQRLDVVDELLPYVQGLPQEKMVEIRKANRVARFAIYRGQA